MEKKQYAAERKIFLLFPFLLIFTAFMMLTMSMRAAGEDNSEDDYGNDGGVYYYVNPGGISAQGDNGPIPQTIANATFDTSTRTLSLSRASINGTLHFNADTFQGNVNNQNDVGVKTPV